MSEDTFEIHRQHKFLDWLEGEVTDYANTQVIEWFGVDEVEELTEEQIQEVADYSEGDDCDSWIALGLRNVVNNWQNEHDNFDIL
jgi:hypothetical protein